MGFIYETQGNITFLVYELSRDEGLEPMTMGMMENNRIEGIIPAVYTQIDERRLLKYNVSARVSLKQYFSGSVAKRQMLGILFSLVSAFLAAEEYMLEPKFFELDPEWIFVDVSRVKAGMICLPVEKEEEEDEQVRLDEFFKQLVFGVRFDTAEDSGYVAKLISFLNGGRTFSLQELQKLLKELMKGESASPAAEKQSRISGDSPAALAQQRGNSGLERERFCSPDLREFRERRSQGPARSRASRECPLRAFPVRRLPASLEPFRRRLWRLTGRQNRGKSRNSACLARKRRRPRRKKSR